MPKTILFQGDSITDAGRDRAGDGYLGQGYPTLVKADLAYRFPGEYRYINRAVGGDTSADMAARLNSDILAVEPDYMSILVGVNDVWHRVNDITGEVPPAEYEDCLRDTLGEVKKALPRVKIMVLEPYVLRSAAACNTPEQPDRWKRFYGSVRAHAEAAKRVTDEFDCVFVPLQERFEKAAGRTGVEYWLADGVHPTVAGHELIKRAWLAGFRELS